MVRCTATVEAAWRREDPFGCLAAFATVPGWDPVVIAEAPPRPVAGLSA